MACGLGHGLIHGPLLTNYNAFATTINPNRAQGPGENHPNQVAVNNGGQGRRNQGNQARGRAFMLGAEEARQDPNIVTGMFTLNNHFAATLFDSGADYSFVSTTFIPLLVLEPNDLGFRYEIKIASGHLVEIDKVIKGCKLEIEGHVFDIDLIPFGHWSFEVIIGMDWLSNYKAEIIFHEKVSVVIDRLRVRLSSWTLIIAWSWALVTLVVVVAVGAGVVVARVDLVALFGAIFFNHKKIQ
ncbi:putative reverse transcriptase domain-containing protein [Tanacetum coccineum]